MNDNKSEIGMSGAIVSFVSYPLPLYYHRPDNGGRPTQREYPYLIGNP